MNHYAASSTPERGRAVIGIDIGGTGTRVVAISPELDVLAQRTIPSPRSFTGGTAAAFLRSQIEQITQGFELAAIGIGASGPIDADGIIRNPDTLPAFTGEPFVAELADAFKVPALIDNDAVCAAVAEHRIGAGRGSDGLLHVTLGTGIGVSFLANGVPVRGSDGRHPEAGHIAVSVQTPRCYCGRHSCWEQAASRQTLQRTAGAVLGRSATDSSVIGELASRAESGDEDALAVFHDYGVSVADGLATLLAVHRAGTVVIGGSAATHFRLYREAIDQSLRRLDDWISDAEVLPTELDDHGGAIGGALLALTSVTPGRYPT
jgi:glucokinase